MPGSLKGSFRLVSAGEDFALLFAGEATEVLFVALSLFLQDAIANRPRQKNKSFIWIDAKPASGDQSNAVEFKPELIAKQRDSRFAACDHVMRAS
jgi:hypothetical protein